MQLYRPLLLSAFLAVGIVASATEAQTTTVDLPAASTWFDSGVNLAAGQRLRLTASGQWSNGGAQPQMVGPGGWPTVNLSGSIAPGLPFAALVGRVGDKVFLVGTDTVVRPGVGGRLYLSMNDIASGFGDNTGTLRVTIAVLSSIPVEVGKTIPPPAVFLDGRTFTGLAAALLSGGRLQLSQTTTGTPKTIDGREVMSYISFGPTLQVFGVKDFAIDLPTIVFSFEQLQNTGGVTVLAHYILAHGIVFSDRMRFLLNNIHADFDRDLTVRLEDGQIVLDLRLNAPDPAIRGEGNGFLGILGAPIPLGWEDSLCPDLSFTQMTATARFTPIVANGKLELQNPTVKPTGDLSLSIGDWLVKDYKAKMLDGFEKSLNAQLAKPAIKGALEKALTSLLLGGKPNTDVADINIDPSGIRVTFNR